METESLHMLYRICMQPLQIYEATMKLLNAGAAVNCPDEKGLQPLALLLLHVNRGLRYHPYTIPELESVENWPGNRERLEQICIQIDREYQEQVKMSMAALLRHGADVKALPQVIPAVLQTGDWAVAFEHKLVQSECRWNLLINTSMEYSTYHVFNPLSKHSMTNSVDICTLHIAAWRGDATVLAMLIQHGAQVTTKAIDGRTALHFLYIYCNKPCDLVRCTKILIDAGCDVHSLDSKGRSPIHLLLYHVLTKRSHIKYLANAYTVDGFREFLWDTDNIHNEVKECVGLLMEAGADVDLEGKSALQVLFECLEQSLESCDEEFQTLGHYLVPYQYRLAPIVDFTQYLITKGSKATAIGCHGQTLLHKLMLSVRNLSLDESLNPPEHLLQSFHMLLQHNVNPNTQDNLGRSVLDYLFDSVTTRPDSVGRYLPVIELLVHHQMDVNLQDKHGSTVMHRLLGNAMNPSHLHSLLCVLFRAGARVSIADQDGKFALNKLLSLHVFHHDPLHLGALRQDLHRYLITMEMVASCMSSPALNIVIGGYQHSGFCGLVCTEQCPVYILLSTFTKEPRRLQLLCKNCIMQVMGRRYLNGCQQLPLPTEIINFLWNFQTS